MPDITYDVGRVSFVMKGAWNLATAYEKLDAVTNGGNLYIAKQDVPGGTAITNTTYWQLAAEKGDKGDTGGVDSVNGQQGDVWFPDSRQLISDSYTTDTEPFLMKGNDSDSDRFELAKKLGNTVCVNQLVKNGTFADSSYWSPNRGTISVSGNKLTLTASNPNTGVNIYQSMSNIAGHIYLCSATLTSSVNTAANFILGNSTGKVNLTANQRTTICQTIQPTTAGTNLQVFCNANGDMTDGDSCVYENVFVIDLTLWYGSDANIPSDLLSHPENWGRYYAGSLDYNVGTLGSADGSILTSLPRNLFDVSTSVSGEWINPSTGAFASANNSWRSDYIPTIPTTEYFLHGIAATMNSFIAFYDVNKQFISRTGASASGDRSVTTPSNCYYIAFCNYVAGAQTYTDTRANVAFSLYYSGESGYDQSYPYSVLASVDTGSEVLRSAGAVADEKTPDGTITRRVGVVDLGTLTWAYSTGLQVFYVSGVNFPNLVTGSNLTDLICSKYPLQVGNLSNYDKVFNSRPSFYGPNLAVVVKDTTYSDAAAFKTAMSGVYLYYELATPTTEQGTAFAPIVATVKNGVLSWTNTKGIPVGHESHYFENLRKRVEDRLPDPPSGDGTYRLTCTITGGVKVYSWEA